MISELFRSDRSFMQFLEGLTDRQAADAVRSPIDWKYALGLELIDSGFDFSVLSQFRVKLYVMLL